MAKKQYSELVTGIFVILSLAAGVAVLLWLGSTGRFEPAGHKLAFSAPLDAGELGLEIGSVVKLGGKEVGRVGDIRVDAKKQRTLYVATLSDRDYPIRQDALALASPPFIGTGVIIITNPGTGQSPPANIDHPVALSLAGNPMIQQAMDGLGFQAEQRRQFQQALRDVADTAGHLASISGVLDKEFSSDNAAGLLSQVHKIAAQAEQSADNLAAVTAAVRKEINPDNPDSVLGSLHAGALKFKALSVQATAFFDEVAPKLQEASGSINTYVQTDLRELFRKGDRIGEQMLAVLGDVRAAASTARDVVVANRDNIQTALDDFQAVGENLSAAAREIRRNPWRLMQKPTDKDVRTQNLYDAIRAYSDAASKLEGTLAKLSALQQSRPPGAPEDPELLKLRAQVEESLKKLKTFEDSMWKELSK
jgi:ABC-type transporter Mla subunit MlaD